MSSILRSSKYIETISGTSSSITLKGFMKNLRMGSNAAKSSNLEENYCKTEGKGIASPESSGLITALSECAKKLHPNESILTIVLENNEKQCLIQSNDKLIVSIYKNVPA